MTTTPPLSGVRVLDFGRFIAAPYCGMVLADMGAEVIRVERPGGEVDRRLGLAGAHGENFTFPSLARGKKGITLDLHRAGAARAVLWDLVARSDVLLHNFGPGAAAALGLTYEDVRPANPAIIYAGISFSGTEGAHAGRTGFDMMAQMGSGAAAVTGREGEPPLRTGVPWVDYGTGLSAVVGILLALRHRDATGQGQAVDCALLRTALSFTAPIVAEALVAGRERPRLGNQAAYVAPSNLYRCRDGHVYLAAITASTWRSLAELIGCPDLAADPDLRTPEQRFERLDRVEPPIERWTSERTVEEALRCLEAAQVPAGAYRSTGEVADDPHSADHLLSACVDLGEPGYERVPVSRTPVRLSGVAAPAPTRPPRPGEHNEAIYRDLLGYDEARLARLRADGLI